MNDKEAINELVEACKAVLDAVGRIDFYGQVAWIMPPYQAAAVHESAHDRLRAMIEKYDTHPSERGPGS